jgi:mannose/fructose/N-acetylgalactosamine-specific phosphotransferase system component IID
VSVQSEDKRKAYQYKVCANLDRLLKDSVIIAFGTNLPIYLENKKCRRHIVLYKIYIIGMVSAWIGQ